MNHGRTHGQRHGRTTRKHIASAGAYRRRRLKNLSIRWRRRRLSRYSHCNFTWFIWWVYRVDQKVNQQVFLTTASTTDYTKYFTGFGEIFNIALLQICCWESQWKNFENRSALTKLWSYENQWLTLFCQAVAKPQSQPSDFGCKSKCRLLSSIPTKQVKSSSL